MINMSPCRILHNHHNLQDGRVAWTGQELHGGEEEEGHDEEKEEDDEEEERDEEKQEGEDGQQHGELEVILQDSLV